MKPISLLILLFTLFIQTGCRSAHTSLADFSEEVYTPEYATGYAISGSRHSASTLLTIRNPWQGAEDVQQQIFLSRKGEPAPDGFTGQVVHTPIRHAICMSSSYVAMLDAIGEVHRIVGVSGLDFISNTYINKHKLCGEIRDVGYDTNINFELIVALHPDVVLLYGVTGENPAITGKLVELGIPYIYVGDYVEESPLGKAEWLVALSEMCNEMEKGREVFSGISNRYNALKEVAARQQHDTIPRIMLNTPYRDSWFMPSTRSYMVQLIQDAGGEYIYTKNNTASSVPIDAEEAYALAHEADLWLNIGQFTTLEDLKLQHPKFADLPVIQSGRVYNNNLRHTASGGSDFWESGIVCPDKILADLIHIFRNEESAGLYYYQKLQ